MVIRYVFSLISLQLCEKDDASKMSETIFDILTRYLYTEHVDYAIDLSLAGLLLFYMGHRRGAGGHIGKYLHHFRLYLLIPILFSA